MVRPHLLLWACFSLFTAVGPGPAADSSAVTFEQQPGKLNILLSGQPLATYVYQDATIPRPYFAHVRAPGGVPVTRHHPPIEGKDATDHADLHPGLWLAFGELSGADFWRNKAKVTHEKLVAPPGNGSFAVENVYRSADGSKVVGREVGRYSVRVRPAGHLLLWDAEFRPGDAELVFGDQEEMGLGARLATALTVKGGGQITGSGGEKNEREVRGKQHDWCDYSGVVNGQRVGVLLVPDPRNFRRSWFHARDYGLLVANPFARKALGRGDASRIVVKPGESLRLRFGVLLHSSPAEKPLDLPAAAKDVLQQLDGRTGP